LAFHFAETIAYDRGWEAGQTASDLSGSWYWGEKGILLIIDYPEERKTTVKQFLKSFYEADISESKKKFRILLLSRDKDFPDFVEEEAPRLSNIPIHLDRLDSKSLQWDLANETWRGLLYQQKKTLSPLKSKTQNKTIIISKEAFLKWVENSEINGTPLMILSLVYYLFSDPDAIKNAIVDLSARSIVRYMTKREIRFIRKEVSEYFGLKKLEGLYRVEDLFILKGVAAIRGGISKKEIDELLQYAWDNEIQLPPKENIMDLTISNDDMVFPIQPDILAADFFYWCVSEYTQDRTSNWINISLGLYSVGTLSYESNSAINIFSQLGRVVYDILIRLAWKNESNDKKINLLGCVVQEILSKEIYVDWVADNITTTQSNLLIKIILKDVLLHSVDILSGKYKKEPALFEKKYSTRLNDASVILDEIGEKDLSLDFIQKAIEVTEDQSLFDKESIAQKLNNLSNSLFEVGDFEESLQASNQSIEIRRQLYALKPDVYGLGLARSLNNLSMILRDLNANDDSLAAIREAVNIFDSISKLPEEKTPLDFSAIDLTSAHVNYGKTYANLKDYKRSLQELIFSAKILDVMAQKEFDLYADDLSDCLNVMSVCYYELDRFEESYDMAFKAVSICQELLKLDNPHYKEKYASYLRNLAKSCLPLDKPEDFESYAMLAFEKSKKLFNDNPVRYGFGFIESFNVLINYYNEKENFQAARVTCDSLILVLEQMLFLKPSKILKTRLAKYLIISCYIPVLNPAHIIRLANLYKSEFEKTNLKEKAMIEKFLLKFHESICKSNEVNFIPLTQSIVKSLNLHEKQEHP
jgi:hypothetical protein